MLRIVLRFLSLLVLAVLLVGAACTPRGAGGAATPPAAMPPHPRLEEKIKRGELKVPHVPHQAEAGTRAQTEESANAAVAPAALSGSIKALAVLVDFSDKVKTVQAGFFDSLIFAPPVAGQGSVRDYYNDVSYGQVDIFTIHLPSSLGWQRAPQTHAYYVGANPSVKQGYCIDSPYPNNCQKLAEDIVDAINGVVDFSQYDNNHDGQMEPLMIVHAGPGAEFTGSIDDIWSHSWALRTPRQVDGVLVSNYVIMPEYWLNVSPTTSDMTIGVFAHEMGHGFWGLPDLYDTDYSSQGIGNWSLMAGGSWNGPANLCSGSVCYYSGSSPALPDAWTRVAMGFATPTTLTASAPGLSIPQASASGSGTIFKLKNSVLASQEYFLVENRQAASGGYDQYLPGSGLAIWHIDEAKAGNTQECKLEPHSLCGATHYKVALEQADGLLHLENNVNRGSAGDLFSAGSNSTWNGSSNPESSSWYAATPTNIAATGISAPEATMTADLLIADASQPAISINDVSQNEGNSGTTDFVFTVSLSAPAQSTVSVSWATANGAATAGSDYVAASGTLSFTAGESSKTVTVQVNGDTTVENNENFYANLSNASGATIADGQGVGTIVNDDQAPPATTISINDVSQNEGNSGTTNFVFTISLSAPARSTVRARWATANGTATSKNDYIAGKGTLSIPAGQTSSTVTVQVRGDATHEADEMFYVNLTNPVGATIADKQGAGIILNDD